MTVAAAPAGQPVPPGKPDHGINNTTFHYLWSHDTDYNTSNATRNMSEAAAITNVSDVAFNRPTQAVQQWNRQDLGEFPIRASNRKTAIYPAGAETKDTRFIKDAYVELFAIQPSTRALLGAREQPLYVPPSGRLLGTLDYRVGLPKEDTSGGRQVYWDVGSATIDEVRVVSGATTLGTATPGHVIQAAYSGLSAGKHRLGLEATITAEVVKTVRTRHCSDGDDDDQKECHWTTNTKEIEESVTVRDTRWVTQYRLLGTGYLTQYPNGDMGLLVQQNRPWAGIRFPGGDTVTGRWQFYTGRDRDWDTLTVASSDSHKTISSPAVPLQTYAFPSMTGLHVANQDGRAGGQILFTQGQHRQPPTLPEKTALPVPNESYKTTSQLAVRHPSFQPGEVRIQGLVAGTSATVGSLYQHVQMREADLSLAFQQHGENITVIVHLQDATGDPIQTTGADTGYVEVAGQRVETNASGLATVTVSQVPVAVTATYHPAPWWVRQPTYTSATAVATSPTDFAGVLYRFLELLLHMLIMLVPVYMFDKLFRANIWPPWRKIW